MAKEIVFTRNMKRGRGKEQTRKGETGTKEKKNNKNEEMEK